MVWTIEFDESVVKDMKKLSRETQRQIRDYLRQRIAPLGDPRQFGAALRYDKSGWWRYRVGKYRIICTFEEARLVVLVLRVAKRDKAYD